MMIYTDIETQRRRIVVRSVSKKHSLLDVLIVIGPLFCLCSCQLPSSSHAIPKLFPTWWDDVKVQVVLGLPVKLKVVLQTSCFHIQLEFKATYLKATELLTFSVDDFRCSFALI